MHMYRPLSLIDVEEAPEPVVTISCYRRSAIASVLSTAALLVVGVCGFLTFSRAGSGPAFSPELRGVIDFINWDDQAKLPPWLSPISEGAAQGVAVVLGQSLKPDGTPPQALVDRAKMAKKLLDEGKVIKVIVSGGDPAGVGKTEASMMAAVLQQEGIPKSSIIQESQATTSAENAWFALRWIPKGTGQFYIVTSDFHMARATYIFKETFNYFYTMVEEAYKDDPAWKSQTKKYPRLNLVQAPTKSFCGSDASLNEDKNSKADVNSFSLRKRVIDELGFLGSGEVSDSMYGAPLSPIMYIWPVQVNVTKDPDYKVNFHDAMAQQMRAAQSLCKCVSPPEQGGPELSYPMSLPIPTQFQLPASKWRQVINECYNSTAA
mmetsp:Transcript_76714/g.135927  ORF Transcript_76714/g.135927 Transcript_76714/m.135927 type:complete len:377 (+) Transcript_76714:72-1202(+)